MNHTRQGGFVMVLAVTSLALLAGAAVVITQTSFALRVQSDQAYVAACERNLAGSALAWAQGRPLTQGEKVQLDVSALDIPGGVLRIAPAKAGQTKDSLQIDTECRFRALCINSVVLLRGDCRCVLHGNCIIGHTTAGVGGL